MANSSIDTSIADLADRDATLSYDDDFEEDFSLCVARALCRPFFAASFSRSCSSAARQPSRCFSAAVELPPATPTAAAPAPQQLHASSGAVLAQHPALPPPVPAAPLSHASPPPTPSSHSHRPASHTSSPHLSSLPPSTTPHAAASPLNILRAAAAPSSSSASIAPSDAAALLPPNHAACVGVDTDIAGWGTWSSRQPPPAALPTPAASLLRSQADCACQVQIIDAAAAMHNSVIVPPRYADAAVQAERPHSQHDRHGQQQQHCSSTAVNFCPQQHRSDADYVASSSAAWGDIDFIPAPNCSALRHPPLQREAKQPRQCTSAHYEQLLCVRAAARALRCAVTRPAGTTSPRPTRSCCRRRSATATASSATWTCCCSSSCCRSRSSRARHRATVIYSLGAGHADAGLLLPRRFILSTLPFCLGRRC
jgi:hypothetical protein